jgi:hypothetical protein
VGAGLPAKASAHSTSSSPDTPLSRAGSLPQWSGARPQSSAQPKSLWERACPRRRRHIQHHHCLTQRYREQARSHSDPGQIHDLCRTPNPLWERACSRRRRHIQHHHRHSHRFREQAHSHNGPVQGHNLQRNPNPGGSGLAREGVGTFNIIIA